MDILVVEDDALIGKALRQGFVEAGHACTWVKTGPQGLEQACSQQFDAIVLDLLLPGQSGHEILSQLRLQGIGTPVIVLTALGAVDERVVGLKAGADDYVVKPFALVELLARVEAVCRRSRDRPPAALQVGPLCLDLPRRRFLVADHEIDLTPTEFSILEMLLRHVGQVVTRRMLCEHLWEADWEGTTNVIEVHINRLRNKLQRVGQEALIHTIRGRGYALRTP